MANEIKGTSPSGSLYARIMNAAGLWWNGSAFGSYSSGNYADYQIPLTEQGASGVYVGDFPSGITSNGTYDYFIHRYTVSPAEGDIVVNTGKIDWTGVSSVISDPTDGMTASEWRNYVLRCGFKRTDKDDELYEATTDAIQEMRRRFMFNEAEVETSTTDTISTLGDFKINVESDFGLFLGVVVEDGDSGTPLNLIPKWMFDLRYPSINVESDRGYPRDVCLYAGSIYIGPIPDRTSYVYRKSYSRRAGNITSSTTGVPFTTLYRDILCDNVLGRLYKGLDEPQKALGYKQAFEDGFMDAQHRERVNSGDHCFNVTPFGC